MLCSLCDETKNEGMPFSNTKFVCNKLLGDNLRDMSVAELFQSVTVCIMNFLLLIHNFVLHLKFLSLNHLNVVSNRNLCFVVAGISASLTLNFRRRYSSRQTKSLTETVIPAFHPRWLYIFCLSLFLLILGDNLGIDISLGIFSKKTRNYAPLFVCINCRLEIDQVLFLTSTEIKTHHIIFTNDADFGCAELLFVLLLSSLYNLIA